MKEIEAPASGESRRQQQLPRSKAGRASPRLYHFLASSLLSTAVFLDCHHTPLDSWLGGALRLSLSAFNTWPACWEPRVTMRF